MGSKMKLCEVTYFNAEHPKHKVSNLLSGNGKWTSPNRFKEDIICEFSLQGLARITRIDIGNFWSATVEVSLGLSTWPSSKRELLASHNFMNRITSISGDNKEQMITFTGAHFKEVSEMYWDRIRITCKQPYRFDNDCFGLSIVDVTGILKSNSINQTSDAVASSKVEESELNTFIQQKFNMMKPTKQSPFRPFSSIFSARKSSEKRSPLSTQKTSQSDTVSPSETGTIKVQKDNTPNSNSHENAEVDESNDLELRSAQFFEKCLKFLETTLKDYDLKELEVVSYNMVKRLWIQKFGQDVTKQEKRILKLASEQYLVERVEILEHEAKEENKPSSDSTKKRKISSVTSDQGEEKENKRMNRNAVIDLSEEEDDNIEIKEDSPSSSSHNITNKTPSRLTKRKSSSSEKKQPAKRQRIKSGSRTKIKPDMKAVPNADGWYSPINARNAMEAEKTLPLKFTKAVLGYNPAHLLKIPLEELEQAGVLFQRYNYKTDRCLPLRDSDKPLNVESYETVRFFKCGPDIFLVYRNKFYDPHVKDEHLERVFKNHSLTKVRNNKPLIKEIKEFINNYGKTEDSSVDEVVLVDEDVIESVDQNVDTIQVVDEDERGEKQKRKDSMVECPMCSKLFSPSLIQEHAADCTGLENNLDTSEAPLNCCPLCNKEMELEVLEEHAVTCTGQGLRSRIPKSSIAALRFKHGIIYVDNSAENMDYDNVKDEVDVLKLMNKYDEKVAKLVIYQIPENGNLTAKLPNLKDLTISLNKCALIPWLPILLTQCQSSLESLTLKLVDLDCLQPAGAIKFSSLKSLCLIRCIGAMDTILSGCGSKLKSLEIRHSQEKIPRAHYGSTKKFYAMKGIDSKALTGVKLSQLCLYDCWDAAAVAAILDGSAQTLQQLILHNVYLNKVDKLDNMPKVKSAVFSLCQFYWDADSCNINFRGWHSIENLEIKYTTNHSINGENLPKLKSLKIEYVGPLQEPQVDIYKRSHERIEYEDAEERKLEGDVSDLDEFLNACPVLESLTLKGLGKPNAGHYGEDYSDDEDEEMDFNFKKLNLKSLIIESCSLEYGYLAGLLHASRKTLETLSLVEFDISACCFSFKNLKFQKLKKITVLPRYDQPRIRSARFSVNIGLIYLLRASRDVLQELEIGALYDVHDLLPFTFPNVKIKLTDKQAFSKSELEIINSVFGKKYV